METTFIIKWGNFFKAVQFRRKIGEKGKDNRFWQPTPQFMLYLPDDRQSTSWKFLRTWRSKIRIKRKSSLNPYPRCISVTCKLEKKLFSGVYCIRNSFS